MSKVLWALSTSLPLTSSSLMVRVLFPGSGCQSSALRLIDPIESFAAREPENESNTDPLSPTKSTAKPNCSLPFPIEHVGTTSGMFPSIEQSTGLSFASKASNT